MLDGWFLLAVIVTCGYFALWVLVLAGCGEDE